MRGVRLGCGGKVLMWWMSAGCLGVRQLRGKKLLQNLAEPVLVLRFRNTVSSTNVGLLNTEKETFTSVTSIQLKFNIL